MNQIRDKINWAWLAVFFSIPGLLIIYISYFVPQDPMGFGAINPISIMLALLYFLFLIPAFLVLRTSRTRRAAMGLKIYFDLVTFFILLPILGELIESRISSIAALLVLVAFYAGMSYLGWLIVNKKFSESKIL